MRLEIDREGKIAEKKAREEAQTEREKEQRRRD